MAGGGSIPDLFGALGGGLSALAGQQPSSGGGGGGAGSGITPANSPNSVFTDPLVTAPAALTAGDPTGLGQQQPQQQPIQAPTFTPAQPQQPQPVPYLSPEARDAAIGGAPTSGSLAQVAQTAQADPNSAQPITAQVGAWPGTSPLTPGISPETKTGLTPDAEVAAGYRPPEATDADLAQAAEEQGRNQGAATSDASEIGASSISTDQQSQQQKQFNPLQSAGRFLQGMADRTPGPNPPGSQGGRRPGGGINLVKALSDLITQGPGAFTQDLQGVASQVGSNYGPQDYTSQGGARGYGYGADQPPAQTAASPPAQQPSAPQPPSETAPGTAPEAAPEATAPASQTDMAPGSAAQAIRAGYDRAAAEDRKQQRPIEREPPRGAIGHNYFQRHGIQPNPNMVTTIQTPYGKVTTNKQAAADTQNLMKDLHDAGAPIHKFGSYNVRRMRRGNAWSSHAYGAAFDINNMPAEMAPDIKRWIDQNPQRWHGILAKNNFSQPYPGWDPNHIEWGGPRAGAENQQQPSTAQAATEPQRLFGEFEFSPNSDLTGIVNTTARMAPGGIPWQDWTRSGNVEDARGSPLMTPMTFPRPENKEYPGEVVVPKSIYDQYTAMRQSPLNNSQMAMQLGSNDIDPLLDQLAQQWAQQLMGGQVPMPRPRPR